MPQDVADDLREECVQKLQEIGFDEDYTPTEDGKLLEGLIDKLYVSQNDNSTMA